MKRIKLKGFFKEPDEIIRNEIRENNIQRMFYFSLIVIPVTLSHVILFFINMADKGTMEYKWGWSIIGSHTSAFIFYCIIGLIFYRQKKKKNIKNRMIDLLIILIFFQMIVLGVFLVVFDQIVTPAITPYLVLCVIISLIIIIPPGYAIILYLISYILFFIGIEIYQKNPEIVLSNRVNGITAISLGILLTVIMWRSTITRYKQRNLIEKQKLELEKSLLELKDANASKDKLLGIIAHDLTSPFNLITGLSEFLKENVRVYSIEEIEKHLNDIYKTSLQTQSLLLELLIWARMQTGNIIFNPVCFNLNTICVKIKDTVLPLSSAKSIEIEINADDQIFVFADVEMVKTILRNLVTNAIKYSFPGGKVVVRSKRDLSFILIEVEDNGIGMTSEEMDHLFSLSGKKSNPGTSNESGSGLGLTICYDFVQKCGGKMWAQSEIGKGSKLTFSLPAVD